MTAFLQSPRCQVATIFVVTVLAYATVLQAGFIWDDEDYVTQNPVLREWSGLWSIWFDPTSLPQYYPVVHSTFWLEFRLWGVDATGYHLVNVLLHATNACLLLRILKHLSVPGAFFAALLFAVHPVHVESVAWVTERKNVLSGTFYLLSLGTWLRWVDAGSGSIPVKNSGRLLLLAFVLFLAALLSKTVTCSLPAVALLISYWRNGRLSGREVRASVPFFVIGMALGLMTASLEVTHVGAEGAEFVFTFGERILIAGRAVWFYLGSLVWPVGYAFNYERWVLDSGSIFQWAFPVAATALIAALAVLRNRIGRAPLVTALIFGGSLVPALGFFNVFPMRYSFVADHFQYLANMAPMALFAACAARHSAERPKSVTTAAAATLVVLLGVLTLDQARVYKDVETLWIDTLEKNPKSWLAHTNLAQLQLERGETEAAIASAEKAVAIYETAGSRLALGIARLQLGELKAAQKELERSAELAPRRNDTKAWLGIVLHGLGDHQGAITVLEAALVIREDYDRARAHLGIVLQAIGRHSDALPHLERAMELNPMAFDAFLAAARAQQALGNTDEAVNLAVNGLVRSSYDPKSQATFVAVLAAALRGNPPATAAGIAKRIFAYMPPAARVTVAPLLRELETTAPAVGLAVGKALLVK